MALQSQEKLSETLSLNSQSQEKTLQLVFVGAELSEAGSDLGEQTAARCEEW